MLLRLARSRLAGRIVSWLLTHMSYLLPLDRLRETETLVAFYHPRPSYPFRVLLTPKRSRSDLNALQTTDTDFMPDLFQTVQSIVAEFNLAESGYRLICNGGAYQTIPYLESVGPNTRLCRTTSRGGCI
jgi:histidine triad (HIT) family protein